MVCPTCGRQTGAVDGHCAACGAPTAAVGVLTPPPTASDDGTTVAPPAVPPPTVAPTVGSTVPPTFPPTLPTADYPTISAEATRLLADGEAARPSAPIAVGRRVANRYRVIRLVGIGGMGVVYQAWDEKLSLSVALKMILPPSAADPYAVAELERRFKTELLLSRQVTHKNVVRIHDLGEVDGIYYITMPYIDGSTLSEALAQDKLPVKQALFLGKQIAGGLAAAHEAGVVHRDLKPANIMIDTDNRALIMDFGIAHSAAKASENIGSIAGTLQYMAPEQAEGRLVDQRADIYAFGLILREMLTKTTRPRPSNLGELVRMLKQPLPPIRSIVPEVPEAVEQIVERCLQLDPAARYTTSAELVAALDELDEEGKPLPKPKRLGRVAVLTTATIAVVTLVVAWMVGGRGVAPPHEPVSVLIADFENRVNDPVFSGSIEQALTVGVEGASFITAYPRRDATRLVSQLAPGGKLDETGARLVSFREGVKFVVSGAIEGAGSGYTITANLIDPAVNKTLKTERASARTKEDVLQSVGNLAATLRRDMGDTTPQSAQRAASETFTTTSLDAVRDYTLAQDLQNNSKDDEAIEYYRRAVNADQNFGRAYAGWANSAFQLGRKAEAEDLWKKSLSLMDRMSERERFRTLGGYYLGIARNYEQAIKNYSELVKLYPADRAGHSNLALAYFYTLDFPKALEEGRKAVEIYPGSVKFRSNYALYGMYASQFESAEAEAKKLLEADANFSDAYFPLAISRLVAGDRTNATETYTRMAQTNAPAKSRATMGLADIAMYEGRFRDAVAILTTGIADDQKVDSTEGLASKYVALAEAQVAAGRKVDGVAAARKAIMILPQESVLFPAARTLIATGDIAGAKALAAQLDGQLQTQTRAYAKLIEGEIAMQQDQFNVAIDAFRAAGQLYDAWLVHFDLGVAYARAGHSAEAVSEFDICSKRKGEAVSIFLDDIPSFRYLAPLSYWLARAQEGVGMTTAALDNYKAYIAIRPPESKDPLAIDAQKRLTPAGSRN